MVRKWSLAIISIVIVSVVALALFLNLIVFTKPTSPASKPIFSATLSPLKQTVHRLSNQTETGSGYYPTFYLTVSGNATYPCGVVIFGGLFPDEYYQPFSINSNSNYITHGGVANYDYPISSKGNSNTFIFTISTNQINGTGTYYVSVTDSLGNSVDSNKAQAVFTTQK